MNRFLYNLSKVLEALNDEVTYIRRDGDVTRIRQKNLARDFLLPIKFPKPVVISVSKMIMIRKQFDEIRSAMVDGLHVSIDLLNYGFKVKYYNQTGVLMKSYIITLMSTKSRIIVKYLRKRYHLMDDI